MMKIARVGVRLRYLFSFLLGFIIIGGGILVIFEIIIPSTSDWSWLARILTSEIVMLPFVMGIVYVMFRLLTDSISNEKTAKTLRDWTTVGAFLFVYIVGLAFFGFLFETFTPFLPLNYTLLFLPLVANTVLILILTRTGLLRRIKPSVK